MASRTSMKAKVAMVIWGDAWESPGEIPLNEWRHEPYETYAVGWVVNHDDNGITLCQEWWPRNVEQMRNPTFIPAGMIKKVTYLRMPVRRSKRKRVAKTPLNPRHPGPSKC